MKQIRRQRVTTASECGRSFDWRIPFYERSTGKLAIISSLLFLLISSSTLRILTNLEHLERKYSLNRSLSLNYKSHRSNANECCCNANKADKSARLSLTKDEKTDKNINKRRQLYDTTNTNNQQSSGNASGNAKYRRHSNGSRSIRRRHTVGGTHDYPAIIKTDRGNCQSFISSQPSQ